LNINECISYIDTRFSKLFNDQLLKNPLTEFSFSEVKQSELEYIIKNLNKKFSRGNHNTVNTRLSGTQLSRIPDYPE